MASDSPFLDRPREEWVASTALAFAIQDAFPVSPGHTLDGILGLCIGEEGLPALGRIAKDAIDGPEDLGQIEALVGGKEIEL
jgi:hypothetical protein